MANTEIDRETLTIDFEDDEETVDWAERIVKYGWNDSYSEPFGEPPIISDLMMIANDEEQIAQLANYMLRERGLDRNRGWTIDPPIVQYARAGDKRMVDTLLAVGVPVDECMTWEEYTGECEGDQDEPVHFVRLGDSPLMAAAREGHKEVIKLLLDSGASKAHECCYEIGKFDKGPAAAAVRDGKPEIAKIIESHWTGWQKPITDFFPAKT